MGDVTSAQQFRRLLDEQPYVFAPGVYHAVDARIAERTGHDAVAISGGCTNTGLYGFPDGVIGMTEMVANADRIANATDLPVVADLDTGYGGEEHVRRSVREAIDAGVAAFHVEDQEFPKKCGQVAGKRVVSDEDANERMTVAIEERDETDEDVVFIGRIDAFDADNGSWESAVDRARQFADLPGMDLIFPEMADHTPDDAIRFAESVHETHPEARFMFNYGGLHKWSEEENPLSFEELGDLGYSYIVAPLFALHAGVFAVYDHFADIAENGAEAQFRMERKWEDHEAFGDVTNVFFELGSHQE